MKKYLTSGVLAGMVLACPAAIAESQYPEPFESKIIFQDTDYISEHAQDEEAEHSSSDSLEEVVVVDEEEVVLAAPSASTGAVNSETKNLVDNGIESEKYLLGLVVIAILAGLFFFGSKPPMPSTSVSRYIARRNLAGTGVEKYLFYRGY